MVPVTNGHDKLLVVLIVEIGVIIVDDQGLPIAIRIAEIGIAVVPVGPVLIDSEVVHEVGPRRNWALGKHRRPIHFVGPILEHAMEVDRGTLVTKPIVYIDDQLIAFIDLDDRQWPLTVNANDFFLCQSVRVTRDPGDIEIIRDRLCCAPPGEP